MESSKRQNSLKSSISQYLNRPLWHPTVAPIVLIFIFAMTLLPLFPINDWWLNTKDLSDGFQVYQNPDFVYPPWSLAHLWIYRFMTVTGTRIISMLILTLLVIKRGWSLKTFFTIMLNPFLFLMLLLAGIDILVVILPILLWEASEEWEHTWVARGIAISILIVKPQITFLVLPYLAWQSRHQWKQLFLTAMLTAVITIPISFVSNPFLILQWLTNITRPSEQNNNFWQINNVSLTNKIGLPSAVIIVLLVFGLYYVLWKRLNKTWGHNHSITTLIICSTLISPYTSMQSITGGLAFAPSFIGLITQYIGMFGGDALDLYIRVLPMWIIVFTLVALWFIPKEDETKRLPVGWQSMYKQFFNSLQKDN